MQRSPSAGCLRSPIVRSPSRALRTSILALAAAWLIACTVPSARAGESTAPRPRNVVLLIADGMGVNQLALARYQKGTLAVAELEEGGISFTESLGQLVTDSAASATALATGWRTRNGQVGVRPDGTRLKTVLEWAEELGKATGIVSTSRITHATPAAMATHVESRGQEREIAAQLAGAGLEVILGGGWDQFTPPEEDEDEGDDTGDSDEGEDDNGDSDEGDEDDGDDGEEEDDDGLDDEGRPVGDREDGRDLVREMEEAGYHFVRTGPELYLAAEIGVEKLLGLFAPGAMARASRGRDPALGAMALAALRTLTRHPEGFFLMVEGSQVDWGGHANALRWTRSEAKDFDDTVGEVLRFLDKAGIAEETLVLVTADHETGGLALHGHPDLEGAYEAHWSTDYHTAQPVPVFASGPGAARFAGITDHARIGRDLIDLLTGRSHDWSTPPGSGDEEEDGAE